MYSGLENLQWWRLHNLSGLPVLPRYPQSEKIFLTSSLNVSCFNLCQLSLILPSSLHTWWWRAWICLVNYLSIGTGGLLLDASWLSEPGFLSSQFRCSTPPQLSCLPPYCLYQRPEASLSCGLIRAEKMGTTIYSDSWPCFFCYSPGCCWPSSQKRHMDGLGLASCSPRLSRPFQQCCYGIYKLGWE